jgi:tyrosine-protein kinase
MPASPPSLSPPRPQPLRTTSDQYDSGRTRVSVSGEDPVDVRRYLEALRRSRPLIVAIVAAVTGVVLFVSLALPKNYEATANVVVNNTAGVNASNESIQRELATLATLATTRPVLRDAARAVPHETAANLEKHTSSSVDQNANIIHINVSSGSAKNAAALAYSVAQAFLNQHASAQRAAATSALATLDREIEALRATGSTSPTVAAQLSALQTRAGELESARSSSNSELQLVQVPSVPSSATSPRPLRNAVIAFFASIFLAVLVALGREQLTPRVANQRELGRLLDLPVLAAIPYGGGRINARFARAEHETYQTLAAAVQLALPPGAAPHVIVVTSAAPGEGKTTVTGRLARMLANAGHPTLVVSGDLRAPKLDEAFDVSGRPGLRELLTGASSDAVSAERLEDLILKVNDNGAARAALHVLPSGGHGEDESGVLQTGTVASLIEGLRARPYAYVLVDCPPLLGIADTQMLAEFSDQLLVVGRLDQLTISRVIDLREAIYRVNAAPLGLVVIGTRPAESPYYASSQYVSASY